MKKKTEKYGLVILSTKHDIIILNLHIQLSRPVHTTPEEFENGGFALKTHQMFSVHIMPEEFKNEGFALKTHQLFFVHTTPVEIENPTVIGHF